MCKKCRTEPAASIFFPPVFSTAVLWQRLCSNCFHHTWLDNPEKTEKYVLDLFLWYQGELSSVEKRLISAREEKRVAEDALNSYLNHCICDASKRFIDDSVSNKQINYLKILAQKKGVVLEDEIKSRFGVMEIEDLSKVQAGGLIDQWTKK